MHEFWRDVEPIAYKGRIKVPYAWQAGETASYFLVRLRDDQKIVGRKCPKCRKVLVPPRKNCPFCFVHTDEWVELSGEGEVESFTIVHRGTRIQPMKPPFAYAVIGLDGADTRMVHLLGEVEPSAVREGMRVRPVFAKERKGSPLDIAYFKPVG